MRLWIVYFPQSTLTEINHVSMINEISHVSLHRYCKGLVVYFPQSTLTETNHVSMINEISHVSSSERHWFESRRSLNSYRVLFYT